MMRQISRLLFIFFLMSFMSVSAQQSAIYTNASYDFNRAISLYQESQYLSAQIIFDKIKSENKSPEVQSDCAYYSANCAIRLNQPGADELMENFVKDYPTSPKQNQAYAEVAQFYFGQGKYPQALQWFDKVDENSLNSQNIDQYNFQKGYSYFSANKKKEASTFLNKVVNSKEYGTQAKYYLGFMAYEGDNYKEANKYFDEVADEGKYKEKLSYYQADMNFKSGNFQKAIDLGNTAMKKSTPAEKSELNKIIGESYFNLKQYDKAIPFLTQYKGKKGKWSNTDFYQLGYAYYTQKDYENAILQFNKIISGKDAVAQNAYYHLGESYLKTDKKQQALNAFKNASEMSFDLKLQEDASYNYAKLSYEIGNSYQSPPDVLSSFLTKYPNSPNKIEVESLLIDSYISSKNYKGALDLLEKNKNFANKAAYQKVTFYRGLELYTDGDYLSALAMFKKSIAEPVNSLFTAKATFWKSETEYVLGNFNDALIGHKQFLGFADAKKTSEYKNINYNIAYCYFKLKDYDQAADYFQKQIDANTADKVRMSDSYLRIGDCRFVTTKYWPAMDAYNKVIDMKGVDLDYAAYQKAISYGFVGKNDRKIEDLNSFIRTYPKSQFRDDAQYELGNTYLAEKKDELALKSYDQLINENKNGSYAAKANLRQGLIYYNSKKDELALAKFKKIAADYPNSPEALEAVTTARLIYVDNGKVDEYAIWVKTLNFVDISDADLDNDTYESAEKQYLQNNIKQSIPSFKSYISSFPNGIHALQANFYLAQAYFSEGSEKQAIPNYDYVVAKSRNEFTEQSLARLAQIYLKTKDYAKTTEILKRLEAEADYPQNVTYAQSNLMKTYYEQKDYTNAVLYADKVLANAKADDKVKADAQIIVARSAIQTNDEAKARVAYAKLATISKGELAAEALYYDAYFKNKDGKFEASNNEVQKLTKDYSGYQYFGAKGLLLMAKNFYGLKDSYQATYILESLIKNFTQYPDVVEESQKVLTEIKTQEAKTNSSIQN